MALAQQLCTFTNVSDGTGESAVAKVDVSALSSDPAGKGACTSVNIECIWYTTKGMGVQIFCDATTNVLAWELIADYGDTLDFSEFVGLAQHCRRFWQDGRSSFHHHKRE